MIIQDTISAIATGLTDSGIGIIRISGKHAIEIANKIFRNPAGREILNEVQTHTIHYGFVIDINEKDKSWKDIIIDEVMVAVMKAPRSFTGEDTVEIQCHGGILVMQKILECSILAGARLAEPGEFTKRAFLNGRIDLTRAEAVMDLIHSQNEYALHSSVNQLKGSLAEKIKELRAKIIYEIAFIESALDDPEHISLDGYQEQLDIKINQLLNDIYVLIKSFENGRFIKDGIQTVIIGKPNAGKSSFMNLLLGEDRAIVTDIAGTTRDILQENVKIGGIGLNVIDTAGIRDTDDIVEKIGVDRAKQKANDADLILFIVDSSVPLDDSDRDIIPILNHKKSIILLNKSDLDSVVSEDNIIKEIQSIIPDNEKIRMLRISAKNSNGIHEFESVVKEMFFSGEIDMNNELIITNIRHKEALQNAYDSLKLVKQSIENGLPEDFYSIDLMSAYSSMGRIIGEEVDDDLVEEIFSKFCMGK